MGDLQDAIGALKRAAIDTYMRDLDYRVEGSQYTFVHAAPGAVTRPDDMGIGGGQVLSVPAEHPRAGVPDAQIELAKQTQTESLAENWGIIGERIDAAMEPWLDLPKASGFDTVLATCNELVAGVLGAVTQSGNALTGSGEMAGDLNRMLLESTSFGGGSLDDFKTRYIDDSSTRAARITALAEVLGEGTTAEQEIWRRAEADVLGIVTKYKSAFDAAAGGGSANAAIVISVIGAAVAGAAIFATAGTATAIALAGASVVVSLAKSIESETGSEPRADREFNDVESGLEAFEKALGVLSNGIKEEEDKVREALSTNIDNVKTHADLFQLTPAPIYAWDDVTMYADVTANLSLARTFMPNAATAASAAAVVARTVAPNFFDAILHDYAVGYNVFGAYTEMSGVANLVQQLLDELAWDLERGAQNFELVLLDIQGLETTNSAELNALADSIADGQTHDGRAPEELLKPQPAPYVPGGGRHRIAQIME